MSNILTFDFDGEYSNSGGEVVPMQYHPSAISMRESSLVSNTPGIDGTITFIPPSNTTEHTISISGYFTALIADDDKFVNQDNSAAVGISIGASIAALAPVAVSAGLSSVSLAKGVYDTVSGRISSRVINPNVAAPLADHIVKLKVLNTAMDKSIPCRITWDLENGINGDRSYIIKSMSVSATSINELSGRTMILSVNLSLIKSGITVRVFDV